MVHDLQALLARAQQTAHAARGRPPIGAIVVQARMAPLICSGRKTHVVKASRFDVAGHEFWLASKGLLWGTLRLEDPVEVSLAQLQARREEHCLSDEEVHFLWPRATTFWMYPVAKCSPLQTARAYQADSSATDKQLFQGAVASFGVTGIHIHTQGQDQPDGRHYHVFKMPDGTLIGTLEDGAHQHPNANDALRTEAGSEHQHGVPMPDGSLLMTVVETGHAHDLTAGTTGIDGAHYHVLKVGEVELRSLSAADYLKESPQVQHALPPAPPTSWIAKRFDDAMEKSATAGGPGAMSKPFAGFPTFEACVASLSDRGYDPESARKICGRLQAQAHAKTARQHALDPREVRALVARKQAAAGGGFHLELAVGPVDEPTKWQDTVVVDGQTYVSIGKTSAVREAIEVGDVVVERAAQLLFSAEGLRTLRHVGAEFLGKSAGPAMTLNAMYDVLRTEEVRAQAHFFDPHYLRPVALKRGAVPATTEDDERFTLGIVLEPDTFDAQGEIYSAAAVRAAAHYFMEHHAAIGLMHRRILDTGVRILESYIALAEFPIQDQVVKAGSWLLGARWQDDELWAQVKAGKINAYSIGAFGLREEIKHPQAA